MNPYYDDGTCTIYHGDARDLIPALGECADVVITDPPYSVSVKGQAMVRVKGKGSTNLDFFPGDDDWAATTRMAVAILSAAVAPQRVRSVYAWCGHRQFGPIVDVLERAGWSTRFLVWRKACPIPAPPGSGWNSGAELCVYGYRPGRVWTWSPGAGPRSNVLDADSLPARTTRQGRSPHTEASLHHGHPHRRMHQTRNDGARPVHGQRNDPAGGEGPGSSGHRHRTRRAVLRDRRQEARPGSPQLRGGVMNPLTRLLWWLHDTLIDDTDLDDWAPVIVGLAIAALFGLAIGIANQ